MNLFVLSDLHIEGPEDPLYRGLLKFFERPQSGDTVVLAGDVFDLFVGNKAVFVDQYPEFFKVLEHAAQRGIQIHYIEGNHDFHLRPAFGPGKIKIHSHSVNIEADGKRFYVAHGDTVDKCDYKYLLLRAFFRSPIIKAFVKYSPSRWIEAIGTRSSRRSRKKNPRVVQHLTLGRMEELRKIYRSFAAEQLCKGYDFVVLGHCHDLDEMEFHIGGRQGQYINVGYPRAHGSYLVWSTGEPKIQRESFPA